MTTTELIRLGPLIRTVAIHTTTATSPKNKTRNAFIPVLIVDHAVCSFARKNRKVTLPFNVDRLIGLTHESS